MVLIEPRSEKGAAREIYQHQMASLRSMTGQILRQLALEIAKVLW